MSKKLNEPFMLLLCSGDGIGPEITGQVKKLLPAIQKIYSDKFTWEEGLIGAAGIKALGSNVPGETFEQIKRCDALMTACVGDPAYDHLDLIELPSAAMLKMRKFLDLYANLRPIKTYPELIESSPLKASIIGGGVDMLIIRELVGGLYFGRPKGREKLADGTERGFDTMAYTTPEVERIAKIAFELARMRKNYIVSVDKAAVLKSSELWRETIIRYSAAYPDVKLDHRYVDAFAMQMIQTPTAFDVIVTENTMGDILSDEASVIVGSLGLLPSASLGDETWVVDGVAKKRPGLFEPVHGSAPDIAGQDKANPIAMIMSLAMMLRNSLKDDELARDLEQAVANVITRGYRTPDLFKGGSDIAVGTDAMGDRIREEFTAIVTKQ